MSKMEEKEIRDWPVREAKREPEKKDSPINRISSALHSWLVLGVSNLRMSLTLRIAIHYAVQLLKTTLPAMLVIAAALIVLEFQPAHTALDTLSALQPENGSAYSAAQLLETPFVRAYLTDEPIEGGLRWLGEKLGLAFSGFCENASRYVLMSMRLPSGSIVGVYCADGLFRRLTVLFWVVLVTDLFRVLHFLHRRNRLNHKVLKPIADMAQTAARLSANNLSDRISVDGAKNELKDLALVINSMLDRIELSYNSQKQFVSDASHELRTPIAVIQGYVSMLKRWGKTDPEVLDEGINAIAQEAASMKELVERLLFLARHDKKTLMLEMEDFDPLEVMSEIHREARMLSGDHRFELNPAQNAWITGDKDMIKQLMRILLDNAIKYTPKDGSITLGVKKERNGCLLTVSDTGTGISAEELPKVFDRFYRCDDARKSQTSGHGLGLSIARIIVSAHGGKLRVRSKVGTGTTFSVFLPSGNL